MDHEFKWKLVYRKNKKERELSHWRWTCVLVLLQRWRRPGTPVFTSAQRLRSLVPASSTKCCPPQYQRPRLELTREFFFHFYWWSESQLHAWKRSQDPGTFFQTCCAPFVENAHLSSAGRYNRVTNFHLQQHWIERGSPNALGKTGRCLGGVILFAHSGFPVFAGTLVRGSDRDAAHQTETRECERKYERKSCIFPQQLFRSRLAFSSSLKRPWFSHYHQNLFSNPGVACPSSGPERPPT